MDLMPQAQIDAYRARYSINLYLHVCMFLLCWRNCVSKVQWHCMNETQVRSVKPFKCPLRDTQSYKFVVEILSEVFAIVINVVCLFRLSWCVCNVSYMYCTRIVCEANGYFTCSCAIIVIRDKFFFSCLPSGLTSALHTPQNTADSQQSTDSNVGGKVLLSRQFKSVNLP